MMRLSAGATICIAIAFLSQCRKKPESPGASDVQTASGKSHTANPNRTSQKSFAEHFAPHEGFFSKNLSSDGSESDEIPEKRIFPLSKTIKPCSDFYGYVCSEEIKTFKLPSTESMWIFSVYEADARIRRMKKEFLKNTSNGGLNPRAKMVHSFFNSCLNENARREEIKKIVANDKEIILGMQKEKLLNYMAEIALNGRASIISVHPELINR